MLSATCFNFGQSKILSSGNALRLQGGTRELAPPGFNPLEFQRVLCWECPWARRFRALAENLFNPGMHEYSSCHCDNYDGNNIVRLQQFKSILRQQTY